MERWGIKYVTRSGKTKFLPDANFSNSSDAQRYIDKYHSRVTHKPAKKPEKKVRFV